MIMNNVFVIRMTWVNVIFRHYVWKKWKKPRTVGVLAWIRPSQKSYSINCRQHINSMPTLTYSTRAHHIVNKTHSFETTRGSSTTTHFSEKEPMNVNNTSLSHYFTSLLICYIDTYIYLKFWLMYWLKYSNTQRLRSQSSMKKNETAKVIELYALKRPENDRLVVETCSRVLLCCNIINSCVEYKC